MAGSFFSVGLGLPGNAAEYVPFRSDRSLFDADVILFAPTFEDYEADDSYAGRPLISDEDSPALKSDCSHWRDELKAAVESGKVVFIFLKKPVEVYVDSGERTYSGTGRSRVTTKHVA